MYQSLYCYIYIYTSLFAQKEQHKKYDDPLLCGFNVAIKGLSPLSQMWMLYAMMLSVRLSLRLSVACEICYVIRNVAAAGTGGQCRLLVSSLVQFVQISIWIFINDLFIAYGILFSMGALKMTDMKLQDMKMADQIAGHENARHEIDGPSCRARNCRVVCPTKIRKV